MPNSLLLTASSSKTSNNGFEPDGFPFRCDREAVPQLTRLESPQYLAAKDIKVRVHSAAQRVAEGARMVDAT